MTAAPTPRELEERIASAMWALMYPDHPWDAGEYVGKDMYRLQAKAALAVVREALAEPTLDQLQAGDDAMRKVRVSGTGGMTIDAQIRTKCARADATYRAMLAASPLRAGS